MRHKTPAIVLSLALTLLGTANASDIYKWTDEQGNVQYTDKPANESSVRLDIVSQSTDNSSVRGQVQARLDLQAEAAAEAAEIAALQPSPDEQRDAAAKRTERCDESRERLTRFAQSRRLYREDEDGERVYLDETETQSARDRVQNQVEEHCNS